MRKRIISLVILLTLTMLTACGAPKSSPVEDFTYEFKNGEAIITGYKGSDLDIVIPSVIDERPVTTLTKYFDHKEFDAFIDYDLKSVTIPNGVTRIHEYFFEGCTNLEKISMPDTLKYVFRSEDTITEPSNLFEDTKWYKEQPDGLLYIDNVLIGVKGNRDFETLEIKEGTKSILAYAFEYCSAEKVIIPNSVKYIGVGAFGDKIKTSIDVPNGVVLGGRQEVIVNGDYIFEEE